MFMRRACSPQVDAEGRLSDTAPSAWLNGGHMLAQLARPAEAVVAYERAESLAPRWFAAKADPAQLAAAHVDVARRRARDEGAAGALPSLQAAARLLPSDGQLGNALAGSLRALNRHAEAAAVLRGAST